MIAIGKFRDAEVGEISPRQVLILVEWESRAAERANCDSRAFFNSLLTGSSDIPL